MWLECCKNILLKKVQGKKKAKTHISDTKMINIPVVIQILKTWSLFKIEARVEVPWIFWISYKNYILQYQLNI